MEIGVWMEAIEKDSIVVNLIEMALNRGEWRGRIHVGQPQKLGIKVLL